ncbi:hypothetical protein AXX17_AT3G19310 [Arabidopsis thaliana]|uniref:Uncharacterized protein n=1 Tax=Arabidopsis thaliana TaxID=3702 RepID=A0A178VAZ8_ARATH|nr:hypothetical protein AXX17_AT3G19310 [Arabidopsis thaliana]
MQFGLIVWSLFPSQHCVVKFLTTKFSFTFFHLAGVSRSFNGKKKNTIAMMLSNMIIVLRSSKQNSTTIH